MEEDDGFCPAGCGCIEDSLHYMHCEAKEMVMRRTKHKSLLIKQMRALNTYPGIITVVSKIITHGWDRIWMISLPETNLIESALIDTVRRQASMKVDTFLQGYLISGWGEVQNMWSTKTQNTVQNKHWAKEMIEMIQTYTMECWKERNDLMHGNTIEISLKQRKKQLQQKITNLYKKSRKNWKTEDKRIFKLPLSLILCFPIFSALFV